MIGIMASAARHTRFSIRTVGPYAMALACGLLVALPTLLPNEWLALLTPAAIAPAMVIGLQAEKGHSLLGTAFFAGWILPTTLWFYSFMNPLAAVAASVGWVLLMGNLFRLLGLRRLPAWARLLAFILVWVGWTWVRIRIPVVEDWWLPHLGYAVWTQTGIIQAAAVAGEASVELVVLVLAAAPALVWSNARRRVATSVATSTHPRPPLLRTCLATFPMAAFAIAAILGSTALVNNLPQSGRLAQVMVLQSDESLAELQDRTATALKSRPDVTTVVWPENHLTAVDVAAAQKFAGEQEVNLVVNTTDPENRNVVRLIDTDGSVVVENFKSHIAPGEGHVAGTSDASHGTTTTYVCYDIHYPDIVGRIGDAELTLVPVNDRDFASTEKTFHLADASFRAVRTRSAFALSSTDGPTALVDEHGRLLQQLPYGGRGVATIP